MSAVSDHRTNALVRTSVVIPVRNGEGSVGDLVRTVHAQRTAGVDLEVVVVDDGSSDGTAAEAESAGARVVRIAPEISGNPAAARNEGARSCSGDPIVFLDADCVPHEGWLHHLIAGHARGYEVVGGSLELPDGLAASARCDYYCGWYHMHPRQRARDVLHHPPCNLSVRRNAFEATRGFVVQHPIAYAHEELAWQSEVRAQGGRILFEPRAVVDHHNRPGYGNLLRRNYRWGYSAIEAKAESGSARIASVYRFPRMLVAASLPLAPVTAVYIAGLWARARRWEAMAMFPAILAARSCYAAGMLTGGLRWLSRRHGTPQSYRPRWE